MSTKYEYTRRLVDPYIKDVFSDNGRHGDREIKCVERFMSDLERDDIYLDEEIIKKRIGAAKLFRHTSDKWYRVPFGLQPFQIFKIVNSHGWFRTETQLRRFQKVYLDISRKNGKTEDVCMNMGLHFYFEGLPGSEVYFAATTRDQASIGFETTSTMLSFLREDSARARSRIRILSKAITMPMINSKMGAVSSDAKNLDGLKPNFAVIDEFHAHPNSKVIKVIETGMINRPSPLMYITTTAGFNRTYPCFQFREMCTNLLNGIIEDDTLFPMIFTLDDNDDWENPGNWYKSNPNMGVTLTMDRMLEKYNSAKNEGAASINEFKTKNLNIYTSSNVSFIDDNVWMGNSEKPTIDNSKMRFWGGLDLSNNEDLTVLTLLGEDGSVLPFFMCPQEKVENRDNRDGVDYYQWYIDGYIHMIPGKVVDLRFVKTLIINLARKYNIVNICYDPWRSTQIAKELRENKIPMMEMTQNYKNFTECISDLQVSAISGDYKHGGHPIMRWCNDNAAIKYGMNNTMMFDRANTRNRGAKIDGIVSLAMAQFGKTNNINNKFKGSGVVKL